MRERERKMCEKKDRVRQRDGERKRKFKDKQKDMKRIERGREEGKRVRCPRLYFNFF